MSQQTVLGVFRFLSILFLNISIGYEQNNCPRYFQIGKYVFFKIFEKVMSKKIVLRVSTFVSMFVLNI